MPPYILCIFEINNGPLVTHHCTIMVYTYICCSHNQLQKYRVVNISVCSSEYQCIQLVLVSVWCASTGISYKQMQKYMVFIIMLPSIIFIVGFNWQPVSLNSIHICEDNIYGRRVMPLLVKHHFTVMRVGGGGARCVSF